MKVTKPYTKKYITYVLAFVTLLVITYIVSYFPAQSLYLTYEKLESKIIYDRNDLVIQKFPNSKDLYAEYLDTYPEDIENFVITKEDRFFNYHPGINPVSISRALWSKLTDKSAGGASTITQQLAKILLNNEQDRSIQNKLKEIWYAIALEIHYSKQEILTMYLNTVALGNQTQGFYEAGQFYFDAPIHNLEDEDIVRLIATLSNPSHQNPWQKDNQHITEHIGAKFDVSISSSSPALTLANSYNDISSFELGSIEYICKTTCTTTLDTRLIEKLRHELKQTTDRFSHLQATHGAIVVIHTPTNELVAVVGSPDPNSGYGGNKINMALQPRPVGSTIKPFIYTKGFELGLRPYTKVTDREYKFPVITGFPIYPKNYDGTYQDEVTLHTALSNSLNVPTVKTLEYVGLNSFYEFLLEDLAFKPIVDIRSYAYGIALGGLEMDLLTLSHYFSVFPNEGILKPLTIEDDTYLATPQSNLAQQTQIFDKKHVALLNKVLADRDRGVAQFGLKSNLDVPYHSYAVKTGTSRDFHDSWTIGYTPDFVVGVWLGNAENKPMNRLSGQSGAGQIWKRAMDIVINSEYNSDRRFDFSELQTYETHTGLVYGLPADNFASTESKLIDTTLIRKPHDGDVFVYSNDTTIQLVGNTQLNWSVNGSPLGTAAELAWQPPQSGSYTITATANPDLKETVIISFLESELP